MKPSENLEIKKIKFIFNFLEIVFQKLLLTNIIPKKNVLLNFFIFHFFIDVDSS